MYGQYKAQLAVAAIASKLMVTSITFHGMTPMMPGLGSNSNDEIPTIGYGLWQVDGDTLTYLMTPAVAESALNGQSKHLLNTQILSRQRYGKQRLSIAKNSSINTTDS